MKFWKLHCNSPESNRPAKAENTRNEYAGIDAPVLDTHRYADLLAHWIAEHQTSAALELSKVLVQFAPDPQSEAKQQRRRKNPTDPGTLWETSLEPSPRFELLGIL